MSNPTHTPVPWKPSDSGTGIWSAGEPTDKQDGRKGRRCRAPLLCAGTCPLKPQASSPDPPQYQRCLI